MALRWQTAGGTPGTPVPGHRNSAGLRVSYHAGQAVSIADRPV